MTTKRDIETTARAKFFGPSSGHGVETRRVLIEPDDSVLVWDDVAGAYTRVHSLSPRAQRRIVRAARREHSE